MQRFITCIMLCLVQGVALHDVKAQIEDVFVERYHVASVAGTNAKPLVTYRIYIDLAEDHILQTVYGDPKHMLTLATTTVFHNDSVHGVVFGERLAPQFIATDGSALDSWFAFGFCSKEHKAVPLHLDPDGSSLACATREALKQARKEGRGVNGLCIRDGMVPAERVPETVQVNLTTGYLDSARGGLIESDNFAWGVLSGVKGATKENMVLIAQLTTDGELRYALNVQVRTPEGVVLRCTALPTDNTEERHFPVLRGSTGG